MYGGYYGVFGSSAGACVLALLILAFWVKESLPKPGHHLKGFFKIQKYYCCAVVVFVALVIHSEVEIDSTLCQIWYRKYSFRQLKNIGMNKQYNCDSLAFIPITKFLAMKRYALFLEDSEKSKEDCSLSQENSFPNYGSNATLQDKDSTENKRKTKPDNISTDKNTNFVSSGFLYAIER